MHSSEYFSSFTRINENIPYGNVTATKPYPTLVRRRETAVFRPTTGPLLATRLKTTHPSSSTTQLHAPSSPRIKLIDPVQHMHVIHVEPQNKEFEDEMSEDNQSTLYEFEEPASLPSIRVSTSTRYFEQIQASVYGSVGRSRSCRFIQPSRRSSSFAYRKRLDEEPAPFNTHRKPYYSEIGKARSIDLAFFGLLP